MSNPYFSVLGEIETVAPTPTVEVNWAWGDTDGISWGDADEAVTQA